MRLLDRYLLREFLIPLGYCLGFFLILWIGFDLFQQIQDIQEKHLTLLDVAEFYIYRVPEFLTVVLPIAMLLALLYALTNHARYHEITAIRAAGVSLARLCMPYLAIGIFATAGMFVLDEFCVPQSGDAAEAIFERHMPKHALSGDKRLIKKLKFINTRVAGGGRLWYADLYDPKTSEMQRPLVRWPSTNHTWLVLKSETAGWTNGVWTFVGDVQVSREVEEQIRPLFRTNAITAPEFTETPAEIQSEISITQSLNSSRRTQRADIPIADILNYLKLHPNPDPAVRARLHTKLHGRFAAPCVCIVVVLIAVPFAAGSGRRNVFVGVASSIFIFFIYYFLQQLGFALGREGRIVPWLAAWLPNLIFSAAGFLMMAKVR